jgi:hypothetical protein
VVVVQVASVDQLHLPKTTLQVMVESELLTRLLELQLSLAAAEAVQRVLVVAELVQLLVSVALAVAEMVATAEHPLLTVQMVLAVVAVDHKLV